MNKPAKTTREFFQNIIDEGLCHKSITSSYYYLNDNVKVKCILNNIEITKEYITTCFYTGST